MKTLITVDEFKTYKGITNNDEDSKLHSIIINVSQFIKHYCGRAFNDYITTDKVELLDARIDSQLYLDEIPIISITSLETTSDNVTYTELVEDTDFFVDKDLGIIYSASSASLANDVTYNPLNVRVNYKAGYEELPEDLIIATHDMVEYYRSEEYTPRKAFSNTSVENLGFRETGGAKLPSHIERIIQLYRKIL